MTRHSRHPGPRASNRPWLGRACALAPVLAGAALLGFGGIAAAGPGGGGDGSGKRHGICAKLECSEDQRQRLRTVVRELRDDTKADREAIRGLQREMAAVWAGDAPDEAELARLQAAIAGHRAAMTATATDALMEVHALLTPEQRALFAKIIERRGVGALRGGHHKRGKRGKRGRPSDAEGAK